MNRVRTVLVSLLVLFLFSCKKNGRGGDANALENRPVGEAARALLSADTYTSLTVEVAYMPGFEPDAVALTNLRTFLSARLNKPGGVVVTTREVAAANNSVLSVTALDALEADYRLGRSSGSSAYVYILYTNGSYTDARVLGIAYRATSAVLFGRRIRDNSGALGQPSRTKLETTVLQHELGHLLGLVDIGTPMQTPHKDPGGSAHCNNQSCLMYYAAETTDILGFLVGGNVPPLDANCIQDLRANGGR